MGKTQFGRRGRTVGGLVGKTQSTERRGGGHTRLKKEHLFPSERSIRHASWDTTGRRRSTPSDVKGPSRLNTLERFPCVGRSCELLASQCFLL